MIITNSTPDEYYFNQLIAFLMSIKINSSKHLSEVKVFLANYPEDLKNRLEKSFSEVTFENNLLKMVDSRGFGVIIDRSIRIRECFDKYKEPVAWIDTDVLIRDDISEFLKIKPKQIKILYREGCPERARLNAGVFNLGYSNETYKFMVDWYNRIKVNKRWGDGQLELWRSYKKQHKNSVEMVKLPLKFNSTGHFDESYVVWHCKKGHFKDARYQNEYQQYLAVAKKYMEDTNVEKPDYVEINSKITKKLIYTQSQQEQNKILKKRHIPIINIVSRYADKNSPLLDVGAREGNLLKLLLKNGFSDVTGVDISEDAIEILKERGFAGHVVDAQNFDLNKEYTTIICSHMLEHCPDANKVINNLNKHLISGGILYVEVPRQPKMAMPTKAGHFYHYDELTEFLSLFDLSQWRLLHAEYVRGENKGRIKTVFKKLKR